MRTNLNTNFSVDGKYATKLFTDAAVELIDHHSMTTNDPLFLMLSHLAPHAGNEDDPMQAPEEEIEKFKYIKNKNRRTLAGLVDIFLFIKPLSYRKM